MLKPWIDMYYYTFSSRDSAVNESSLKGTRFNSFSHNKHDRYPLHPQGRGLPDIVTGFYKTKTRRLLLTRSFTL